MRHFLKWLIGCLAIAGIGVALYAQSNSEQALLVFVLVSFVLLLGGNYALRWLKPNLEQELPPVAAYDDIDAYRDALLMEDPDEEKLTAEFAEANAKTEDELYLVFARLAGVKTGADFRAQIARVVADNHLTPLDAEGVDRLAAQIDEKDLRGKSFERTAGVALARMVRADIDVTYAGTSWMGGTPTLGKRAWPRDLSERAMHHLAQIDLATLPVGKRPEGLPEKGALAFFMTVAGERPYQARVIYLPKIGDMATDPPVDLIPIYDGPDWASHVKGHAREAAPVTFPRWPVEMVPLPLSRQDSDHDARQVIADLFPQQSSARLTPGSYAAKVPDFNRPWFWETAQRFAHSVRDARDDIPLTTRAIQKRIQNLGHTYQIDLDTVRNDAKAFSQYVDEVSAWAVSHEPWDRMTQQDADMLDYYFEHVREPNGAKARFEPFYKDTENELKALSDVTEATLLTAVHEVPEVFAKLPRVVRDDVDVRYRLASKNCWHQMFGLGTQMTSAALHYTHHHLLLQLHSDALLHWSWGEAGIVQFWISEEALRQQKWEAVEVTFESGALSA